MSDEEYTIIDEPESTQCFGEHSRVSIVIPMGSFKKSIGKKRIDDKRGHAYVEYLIRRKNEGAE